MAQDLRKSNFSLQKSSTESRRFPTIAVTTPAEGSADPDDIETSSNPEASQKLKRLSQAGLNPLKPVIIANTEFVSVGDGNSPDSTGLKVQLGENNLLSVNSVTKLFEIHRQVRLATINAADVLLDRIKGFESEKVLSALRKKLDTSLEDFVKEDLGKTVDAVIESMITSQISKVIGSRPAADRSSKTKSNKSLAARNNKVRRTKSSNVKEENKKIAVVNKENLIQTDSSFGVSSIFRENKEDPFLRTLVERVIMEKITYDILRYMSGILSLKDAGLARWSVYESLDFVQGEKSFNDDSIEKMISLATGNLRAGIGFTISQDFGEVLKAYSGISTTSSTPDVSLLIQFFISAGESFLRQEDILSEVIKGEISENLKVEQNPKYRGVPKVKKALDVLSSGALKGIYTNINAGENDYFVPNEHKNDDNSFGKRMINNLYDGWASDISKIDIHGELLAASIFGDCIDIASSTVRSHKKIKAFYPLGEGIPSGVSSVEEYYAELIDFDKDAQRSELVYKYKLNRRNKRGSRLVKYLCAKSSNSDELSDYIPFESTTNLTNAHKAPYLTGPEYFYDVAIQRGDESLSEFKSFAENYNDFATEYVNDIYSMTKLDYAVPAAKKLLEKIGDELATASEDGSLDIFLLALISYNARDTEGLLRLFRSISSAARLDIVEDKEGGGVGDRYEDLDPVTTQGGSRRAMRAANQALVKNFLYDAAKISHSLKKDKSKSVLNFKGNRMSSCLKPKEYLEKDGRFSKVENGRTVIRGTGEDNSKRIKYKIHKQSGKKYGTPTGGLNKELRALEGGPNISFSSSTPCPSFKYFITNEHFEDAGLVNSSQRQTFNRSRQDKGNRTYHEILGLKYQGTGVKLASHHRLFLLYSFIAKIINKSARVYVKSFNASGGNNARIEVWMSAGEIQGIARAFKDIGRGQTSQNINSWEEDKKTAYTNTAEHLKRFLESLDRRISKSAAAVLGPALHGQQIYNQFVEASKFIRQGDGTERSRLGISVLKDRKIRAFHNSLDLLTDESAAQIYKSYTTTLLSPGKSSYTQEDVPNARQIKLMMKILTTPGYGLLTSEKRGPKNICHVGVTNTLLNTLRYEAYKDFEDRRFLETRKFCVNIFKRNEIDSQVLVYPKTFLFDSSLMIIDNDHLGEDLNHIKNFSDTWNFNQIIDNIEFTQWVRSNLGDDPFANLSSSFEPVFSKGSSLKNRLGKDVLINHIFDYAFKVYYRYALGIDLNENNFTLTPVRKRAHEVAGGLSSDASDIQNDYDNLINQTRLLYPAANVDQKLASELFRTIEIIGANPGYCLQDKLKKIIYPKKFDKILSILVNEKDFVIYNEAYNKEFLDVFKTEPNFSYTSRINRPETKRRPFLKDPNVRKYIAECDESFPEIFSMYASITILPE